MSKRLQVLLEESELREIRRIAKSERMSVAEWVRQVLRTARRERPGQDPQTKLSAVRRAVKHNYPTADIDQMIAEIERGYSG